MRYFLFSIILFMSGELLSVSSPSSSRIAAVVNNGVITQADLMNRLRFASLSSGLEPTAENLEKMKPQMLRIMIDELLQLQVGKRYGIDISDEHIQATIKDIEQSNHLSEGAVKTMMQDNNIPLKTLENQLRAQLIWLIFIREKYPLKTLEDQVGKKNVHEAAPSLQITDWEIDQEIKRQKEKETKKQYHLAEIVLPFDRPDQEEEVKNTLTKLLEELQKGAQFPALAQQFSQSATASQGGDMGWLTEDQLEPEVKEALLQLQPGQLSMPIRTSQGYVLVAFIEQQLPGASGNTLLTMQQALLPFPADVTEEQALKIMEQAKAIGSAATSCPALEKLAKEKVSATKVHLTTAEPLSSFPQALQNIILSLELNKSSDPLLTQEGALLVMVCDRKTQEAKEFSRDDALEHLANEKHTLLAKRELLDLRRNAFIDMRM
jgi:peptidyl-prolyl cis-trans isomerase SurA